MIVTTGLIVLGAAAVVGVRDLLSSAGPTHQSAETLLVFGHHVTGSSDSDARRQPIGAATSFAASSPRAAAVPTH